MAYENDILTRDADDALAVRTVQSVGDNPATNYDDIYTRDNNGKLAVRVVGGGGDSHNKGYYATPEALAEAYPTAEAGDFAIVESTDTVWIWDSDNSAWVDSDKKGQVTSVNGQTGAVTVQETLVNQSNIKSVNGNSLLGSGDLELSTYLTYPNGWTTTGTTKAFCDDIAADSGAVKGKAYLGEVTLSDLPASMANGEVVVEIMDGTTAANKIIVLSLKSGNVAPYAWQYVYWNGGTDTSGWIETGQQKQADWNQSDNTALDYIKNKPTLGTAAAADATDFATAAQGAKADSATQMSTTTATLAAASWVSDAQTVSVSGVTASNTILVSPAPASATEYGSCGVICTAQAAGTLTFECTTTPTNDLTVNLVILN